MSPRFVVVLLLASGCLACGCVSSADRDPHVHRVPSEYGTLQAALDVALDGDTVVAAPGAYDEQLTLSTTVFLFAEAASCTSRVAPSSGRVRAPARPDEADSVQTAQTVIDGGQGDFVIRVAPGAIPGPTVCGFTLRNATHGMDAETSFTLRRSRVTHTTDAVRVRGGTARVHDAWLTDNVDAGVDVRGAARVDVHRCVVARNGGDGVEVHLEPHRGVVLDVNVRGSRLVHNGENGIQLVGYGAPTDRHIRLEGNLIAHNDDAGVGFVAGGRTAETFEGASLHERVDFVHNTILGNDHGVAGGDRVTGVGNVVVDNRAVGVKNVDGRSVLAHTVFHGNGLDFLHSNVDPDTRLYARPRLDSTYAPQPGSPLVDAAPDAFVWNGRVVIRHAPDTVIGSAADLGAVEFRPPSLVPHGTVPDSTNVNPSLPDSSLAGTASTEFVSGRIPEDTPR